MRRPGITQATQEASDVRARLRASRIFLFSGLFWVIFGGLLSAATANTPTRVIMWMSAYLTLVGGVAQAALGAGQAYLARRLPTGGMRIVQWSVFHVGSLSVIGGVLMVVPWLTNVGTVIFDLSLLMFYVAVRDGRRSAWLWPYRAAIIVVALSSFVGIVLSMLIVH